MRNELDEVDMLSMLNQPIILVAVTKKLPGGDRRVRYATMERKLQESHTRLQIMDQFMKEERELQRSLKKMESMERETRREE